MGRRDEAQTVFWGNENPQVGGDNQRVFYFVVKTPDVSVTGLR
jgi:hypothetical protein